jgi:hypothetical protein
VISENAIYPKNFEYRSTASAIGLPVGTKEDWKILILKRDLSSESNV